MTNNMNWHGLYMYAQNQNFLRVFIFFTLIFSSTFIYAHGTVTSPPSRVWICNDEGPENPISQGCIDAIAQFGTQQFYDFNGVRQGFANGNHTAVVPDGQLGSGGDPALFGGVDILGTGWTATDVNPGPLTITWTNSAPHPTLYYRVYITKPNWNPNMPLTWGNLDLLTETPARPAETIANIDVTLPSRSGRHVIYSVWQRSDSQEAFYSTSDVDFGGSNPPPPPPGGDQKVTVSHDLVVGSNVFVDSLLTSQGQFITGPEGVTFSDNQIDRYRIGYNPVGGKFAIDDLGNGVALEIVNGEIFLPQYASGQETPLGLDATGKIVELSGPSGGGGAALTTFNQFDFPVTDQGAGFEVVSSGVHFVDGTVLTGMNAYLLDNDAATGATNNSATVKLFRHGKTSNIIQNQLIYQITADGTPSSVFSSFTTDTVQNGGSNVIDNTTYIYSIEISYCDQCDFKEVVIQQ